MRRINSPAYLRITRWIATCIQPKSMAGAKYTQQVLQTPVNWQRRTRPQECRSRSRLKATHVYRFLITS
jgi:hypothetical protein